MFPETMLRLKSVVVGMNKLLWFVALYFRMIVFQRPFDQRNRAMLRGRGSACICLIKLTIDLCELHVCPLF